MKYRNTFRPPALKGRAAALILALSAVLLALPGVVGFFDAARPAAAQEKARKASRATKLDALRGSAATARRTSRLGGKSSKADAATSAGQTSALFVCDNSGAGTPIALNQTINGALTTDDCDFGDRTVFDYYRFDGTAGQQVSIALASGNFDAYLFLIFDADGDNLLTGGDLEVGEDDDGFGVTGGNARIPSGSGGATLPLTGRYFIIVNTFPPDEGDPTPLGNYSLTLTGVAGQCGATGITPGGAPINGSLSGGDCRFVDDSFFDAYSFSGTAGQQVSISLTTAYSLSGEGVLYLLDAGRSILTVSGGEGGNTGARIPETGLVTLPTTGTYFIVVGSTPRNLPNPNSPTGGYTLTVASGGQCPTNPITVGQTVNNALNTGDCVLPDGTLADFYTFSGTAGQEVAVSLSSAAFDTYLFLNGPGGTLLAEDDDSGDGTNSRIPANGFITLPATGTYTILANSFPGQPAPTGAYTLTLSAPGPAASNVQLNSATFNVTEGIDRSVLVTVTRTGDTSGEARVSYATTDGSASERKDYTAALGRLRFAPGETSKTFEVVITDDAFAEGAETFTVTLSNPTNATLGATTTATVTINSNDVSNGISPVRAAAFNTEFFVRQHYADFLNRVPDAGGLAFWVGGIEACGQDPQCREVKIIDTSAAFFLSIEFQETGFLAVRTHKTAFGNLPGKPVPITLRDFLSDSRQIGDGVIVGTPGWPEQLEANKVAYFNEFVTRPAFVARYPQTLTAEQFVDALNANTGGSLSQAERAAAINAFNTAGRAAALRSVAESQTLRQAETNRAFVLMQYFGYLRRNPDDTDFQGNPDPQFLGYQFWLNKLNQFNGNYVEAEMVKAFIQSIEYGDRFGQ